MTTTAARRSRRGVLAGMIGAPVAGAAGGNASARKREKPSKPAPGSTKPNIVIIQLDDMRAADWPTLRRTRRMLKGAAWFPNYVIGFPYCSPSRASLLTGKFAHNHMVVSMVQSACFEAWRQGKYDRIALGRVLQQAGYLTAAIGKYMNGYVVEEPPCEGWDRWVVTEAQAHFGQRVSVDGVVVKTPKETFTLGLLEDYAKAFITSVPATEPLFLYFNPLEPHNPDTPDKRYRDRFPGAVLPAEPWFNESDVSDKPAFVSQIPPLTGTEIAKFAASNRARLQMLLSVDDAVSGLLRDLKAAGRLDNTNVFVVSDNGFMLGEHRLRAKHAPYTPSSVVPMLAWGPGFNPGTDRRLVSNVDIAPTCAELAGVEMPEADGFSLLGNRARDFVPMMRHAASSVTGAGRGLRSRELLYFELDTGEREYYDLPNDPFELNNLLPPGYTGDVWPAGLPGSLALHAQTAALGRCVGKQCSRRA